MQSDPPGARVLIGGVETGLVTPADMLVPEPVPAAIELVMPARGRRVVPLTPAALTLGEVRASFGGSGRDSEALSERGAAPFEEPRAPSGTGTAVEPLAPTSIPSSPVSVRVLAGYPFEVSGCGHTGAAAAEHAFQVQAPCTLRLRAPIYFLDVSRRIEASSGQVEIAAPQLARVQMRSRVPSGAPSSSTGAPWARHPSTSTSSPARMRLQSNVPTSHFRFRLSPSSRDSAYGG